MNTITEQVLQHVEELPLILQEEMLHYVEYLTLNANSSAQLTAHCDNEPNGAKLARLMEEASKKICLHTLKTLPPDKEKFVKIAHYREGNNQVTNHYATGSFSDRSWHLIF